MKKIIITIGKRVSTFISIKVLKFRTKELCYAATLILCLSNGAKAQVVSTLAGSTTAGSADGTGTAASFNQPFGVCSDGSGNLYVADHNEIRKIVISTGVVTTFAGTPTAGLADGTGTAAGFNGLTGVCSDGSGNLYVADNGNNEIRKIVIATGVVTTLCGSTTAGSADGTGAAASFHYPAGVCTDGSGNLYVADFSNHEIRKIVIATGVVTTLCGSTTAGSADGTGAAAGFNGPIGVCTDGSGNLYVADTYNNEIRKIVISTGVVTTLAGSTTSGHADGTGTAASFNYPKGVCTDGSGNLYVADGGNNEIRKIVIATGVVSTLAGNLSIGHADGTGTAASFHYPTGVCTDGSGNLYVADYANNEIREINLGGAGIQQFANSSEVSIYPNPANSIINVELGIMNGTSTLQITDMLGSIHSTFIIQNSPFQISVADLSEGVYNVSISSNEGVVNKRLVIVR